MACVASLQRVQEPTNVQARRLNATTRKLQAGPKKLIYLAMAPTGEVDQRSDFGYRRLNGDADDEVKTARYSRGQEAWPRAVRETCRPPGGCAL